MSLIGNGIRLTSNPARFNVAGSFYSAERVSSDPYGARKNFFIGEHAISGTAGSAGTWTYGSQVLSAFNKASSSSWAPTTTANLTAGEVGILNIAFDNITGTDGNNNEVTSVTDSAGNTWVKAAEYTNGGGGAAGGVTIAVWYCNVTSTLSSGGTVTINFSGATTAKAAIIDRFTTGGGGAVCSVVGTNQERQNAADPGSLTVTPSSGSRQHLYYRAVGLESVIGAPTNTAGYTLLTGISSTGGGGTTNVWVDGEYKIATNSSDTSDPTYSTADNASVFIAFDVGVPSTITNIANVNGSQPSGVGHPYAWLWAIKAGGLACRNVIEGTSSLTAELYSGKDLSADLTGIGDINSADMALSTGLSADLTGVGTISSADMVGTVQCTADLTGTGTISNAPLDMLAGLSASLSGTGTITADLTGIAELSADIVVSAAVADAAIIATAVWQSIIDAGYSAEEVLRLIAARELGPSTGGPSAPVYKGLDGTTTRVTATVDSSGNRSGNTYTP